MMAYAWTSPANCTVIGSQPPADGTPFVEVEDGTDPGAVYLDADGALQPVPARPGALTLFSPADARWIDPRSDAECWEAMRHERDSRLRACDWTQTVDAPLTAETQAAWRAYRQALRDLPANTPDPRNTHWPLPPAE